MPPCCPLRCPSDMQGLRLRGNRNDLRFYRVTYYLPFVPLINKTMRKLLTSNVREYEAWLKARKASISWAFLLKKGVRIHGFIMKMIGPVVLGRKGRSLNGASIHFARFLVSKYRREGSSGLALYLKKCQLLLMQSLGNTQGKPRVMAVSPRVATTSKGLPRVIPVMHRRKISAGSIPYIQLWMTLFNFHRVLQVKGKWKLHVIFNGNKVDVNGAVSGVGNFVRNEPGLGSVGLKFYIPEVYARLQSITGRIRPLEWKFSPLLLLSTGPNSARGETSMMACGKDALAWAYHPLFSGLTRFCEITGLDDLHTMISRISYMVSPLDVSRHDIDIRLKGDKGKKGRPTKIDHHKVDPKDLVFKKVVCLSRFVQWSSNRLQMILPAIGRISSKFEKSGKIRVFANVDYWTQVAFRPLHDWIFSILKRIPQDATFDQDGACERFASKLKRDSKVYSFDLSAATDRLPLVFQVEVLAQMLKNPELAVLWGLILVGRSYHIARRKSHESIPKGLSGPEPALFSYPLAQEHASDLIRNLRNGGLRTTNNRLVYAVGQPMGAYTSWAMLALSHHFIVQIAALWAYPERKTWFSNYLVLGDDIVIADREVAIQYRVVLNILEVSISDTKGIISDNGSFEFAKQFFFECQQASPCSWPEMMLGTYSLAGLITLFKKGRVYPEFSMAKLVRCFGFGYKVASRIGRSYLTNLKNHPRVVPLLLIATFPDTTPLSCPSFTDWIRATSPYRSLPLEEAVNLANPFVDAFWEPISSRYAFTKYNTDSLEPYISSTAPEFRKATAWIEEQVNDRFRESIHKPILEFIMKRGRGGDPKGATLLEQKFEQVITMLVLWDSMPKWITPVVDEMYPSQVEKLNRWVRFKLKTLYFLKKKGKVPWDAVKISDIVV